MKDIVSEIELNLLEQFAYGDFTEEEFLHAYPVDIKDNKEYFLNLIDATTKNQDGENLDLMLDVIARLEIYRDFDFQSKFRELIREDWHHMHEILVDSLDKTLPNEDLFIYVLNKVFDYHSDGVEDFMVPIWSKCLWNLYKINTQKGVEVIRSYVNSEFSYLRGTAKKLLAKLEEEAS